MCLSDYSLTILLCVLFLKLEPDDFNSKIGQSILSPQQIGADFEVLKHVVERYPIFAGSNIVGPDIGGNTHGPSILQGYVQCAM